MALWHPMTSLDSMDIPQRRRSWRWKRGICPPKALLEVASQQRGVPANPRAPRSQIGEQVSQSPSTDSRAPSTQGVKPPCHTSRASALHLGCPSHSGDIWANGFGLKDSKREPQATGHGGDGPARRPGARTVHSLKSSMVTVDGKAPEFG